MDRMGWTFVGALVLALLGTPGIARAEEQRVPDVVGLDLEEARPLLEDAGFTPAVRWNALGQPGRVLRQSPAGLTLREGGAVVELEVGGGPPGARAEAPPPAAPVVAPPAPRLAPPPGLPPLDLSTIPRGRRLDRNGPPLPSALGLLEAEAQAVLEGWSIRREQTVGIPDLAGRVVNQVPFPGSPLAPGETVTLVVAVEAMPDGFGAVPDLGGLRAEEASLRLERAGFGADLRAIPSEDAERGSVLFQRPLPGSLLPPGEKTLLFVGLGGRPDAPPALRDAPPESPPSTVPPPPVTALTAPAPISPSEGQSFPKDYGSTFQWTAVPGATGYEWELQVEEREGEFVRVLGTTIEATRHRPHRMERGSFRWRVRALGDGRSGPWSPWFRLYMY